jgi:8-oxo-dGTP pyrophosphatase MutT (NUDIX family)
MQDEPVWIDSSAWPDFCEQYSTVEAAGGLVFDTGGRLLVFFRRGWWDLPKGKVDPGETPEQAAVREVMEETGLINPVPGDFFAHTWHTYKEGGTSVLKRTWWYRMHTTDDHTAPQAEEGITEIRWVHPKAWLQTQPVMYKSLIHLLEML